VSPPVPRIRRDREPERARGGRSGARTEGHETDVVPAGGGSGWVAVGPVDAQDHGGSNGTS
jgi:hypothetical protein